MANVKILSEAKKYFNNDGCYLLIKHVFDMDENVLHICISVEKNDTTWFARTHSVKPEYCDRSQIVFRVLVSDMLCLNKDSLFLAEHLADKCERMINNSLNNDTNK